MVGGFSQKQRFVMVHDLEKALFHPGRVSNSDFIFFKKADDLPPGKSPVRPITSSKNMVSPPMACYLGL